MNLKNYLIGAGVSALIIAGATFKGGERTKVSVVHYSQGETMVFDTIFDATSGYTAEQFLLDNGINPEKTNFIHTDAFDGKHILEGENSVLFMRSENDVNINGNQNIIISKTQNRSVISDRDEARELIVEEMSSEDFGDDEVMEVVVKQLQDLEEESFVYDAGDGNTHLKIENLNGEISIELNGEKLDLDELLENENLTEQQVKMVKKHLNSDGENQNTVFELKTDNDHEAKVIVISNETIREQMEDMEETLVEVISSDIEEVMHEFDHTIAIVSTVTGEDAEESFIADPADLPIEGPKYFPNPTEGKFRLEFFLPERGQTQIQLFDMTGRVVFDENLGNFQGAFNNDIDISHLESGQYIMHITQNNLRLAEKIIVN
ncbi:MAG: T9SS type A sorting domain-containing protein [Cryomorphaceae bacterium]